MNSANLSQLLLRVILGFSMQLFCTCTGLTRKCNGDIRKKIVLYKAPFSKSKQKKFHFVLFCFLLAVKKSHLIARLMARAVQLLRHDAYCPIKLSY